MDLRFGSKACELIGLLFGWMWLFAFITTPVLIYWAIFGNGRWYYPLISLAIGGFCKALCREYKKQSVDMYYESTGKDYASEWINLPEKEKKNAVVEAFKAIATKYYPNADINSWIIKYEQSKNFDDFVREITQGYRETGLRKPYQVVCNTFIDNYFLSLTGIKQK